MRLHLDSTVVLPVVLSLSVFASFLALSVLLSEFSILYLGLPFTLSTFVFGFVIMRRVAPTRRFTYPSSAVSNISLGIITVLCVVSVVLIPVQNSSVSGWTNPTLWSWARYVASIVLTLFLPGYLVLKIVDTRGSIDTFAKVSLSYILSMFITFVVGFLLLLLKNSISASAALWLVVANLALLFIYYTESFFKRTIDGGSRVSLAIDPSELIALLATLLIVIFGNFFVMSNTLPLSGGDMWNHYALALQYSKNFPVHEGMVIPGYPYLFPIYLATLFQLSGLSSPISFQAMFALSFIVVLSFYPFIKEWFRKKEFTTMAMLLIPLLGFGSLYLLSLRINNPAISLLQGLSQTISKTYDINDIMVIGPSHSNVVPLIFIALPAFFMFLYLFRRDINNVTKFSLSAIIVATAFLGHVDISFFMSLALLLYALLTKGKGVIVCAAGGILGLLIVFMVDIAAPARFYTQDLGGITSGNYLVFFATFLLFSASCFVSFFRKHVSIKGSFPFNKQRRAILSSISVVVLFFYFFSIATWTYVLPNYNALTSGHYNFTPFFVWAIRFGPIGFLFILGISLYLVDIVKDKTLMFFASIAAAGFILEQIANFYPIYPAYRFATLTLIGAVPIAAYFVVRSSSSLSGKKRTMFVAVLLLLMIPGMFSSSLYYFDRGQLNRSITTDELAALNFIERTCPQTQAC